MPQERADETAVRAVLDLLHARLDGLRETISRELCAVPPPVPACDVDFNLLLADRGRIVDELESLARLRASRPGGDEVLAFCRASWGLDAESRAAIEAKLRIGV
jgi:hypothetical protein